MAFTSIKANDLMDILDTGMDLTTLGRTDEAGGAAWVQNLTYLFKHWSTREGLGTVGQWSSTLTGGRLTPDGSNKSHGYRKRVGSHLFITDFGHQQLIVIHLAEGFTANAQVDVANGWVVGDNGQYRDLFTVNIIDLTTETRLELALYAHTSSVLPVWMATARGNYQSTGADAVYTSINNQAWTDASDNGRVYFSEMADTIYFGSPAIGLWKYRPVDPALSQNPAYVDVASTPATARPIGESCLVQPVVIGNGLFSDAYTYLTPTELPNPSAVCTLGNRMVVAQGRGINFSDVDRPDCYMAGNFFPVPSEQQITACRELKGNLFIFTANETWLYTPNTGDALVSGGRILQLSSNIGCAGPGQVISADSSIIWTDPNGAYSSNGGLDITNITSAIRPLFVDPSGITSPLTAYYTKAGFSPLSQDQPRTRIQIQDGDMLDASLAWDTKLGRLFIAVPSINGVLVNHPGQRDPAGRMAGWALWLFDTVASAPSGTPQVGDIHNLNGCAVHSLTGSVYFVGGPDNHSMTGAEFVDQSFYVCQLGRGGGLDRSNQPQEDNRAFIGEYKLSTTNENTAQEATFWVGEAVKQPDGWQPPTVSVTDPVWRVPIFGQPEAGMSSLPKAWSLHMRFDNTKWRPVLVPANVGEMDFDLPNLRTPSRSGFKPGAPDATHRVRLYDSGTGLPSNTGDEIYIDWEGTGGAWANAPYANLLTGQKNPLMYLLMQRLINPPTSTSVSFYWDVLSASFTDMTPATFVARTWLWQGTDSYPQDKLGVDGLAQAVDWAYQSRQVGDDKLELQTLGLWVKGTSYGQAIAKIVPGWIYGLLNTVTGSDYRPWASQLVDYAAPSVSVGNVPGVQSNAFIPPLWARIKASISAGIALKTFGNVAKWGTTADASKGNLLVDDPAVDSIATTAGDRGGFFSWLLHGVIQNKAEKFSFSKVTTQVRVVGSKRRTGRPW